ncbi:MAG: TraB/GumN family protein [Oscillospiraceae bacterium]|nr:TraB/GumN family protein [Oscillospiraceae bacterium]
MKRIFALLLALVLIFGLAACGSETEEPVETPEPTPEVVQTPEPVEEEEEEEVEEEEEPAANPNIHGALHRIEYGDNVVYLFGSLHGGRDRWYPLADVVEDAMDRADIFVTEIGHVDAAAQAEALQTVIALPDGQTWAEFFPADVYEHLVEMAEIWGLPYEEVNTENPAFFILSIEMEILQLLAEDMELGNTAGDISVDGYVMDRALERARPIISLETVEQQMQILYRPPAEVVAARALSWMSLEEMMEVAQDSDEPGLDELADMYEANDLVGLADMFGASISLEAEAAAEGDLWIAYMREYVMNWRSTYYANEIARLLQETEEATTFFVVVGISHIIRSLFGEEFTDIVEQLELLDFEAVPMWQ